MILMGTALVALSWGLIVFGHVGDPVYGPVFGYILHSGFFLIVVGVLRSGFGALRRELALGNAAQPAAGRNPLRGGSSRGHRIEPTLVGLREYPTPARRDFRMRG